MSYSRLYPYAENIHTLPDKFVDTRKLFVDIFTGAYRLKTSWVYCTLILQLELHLWATLIVTLGFMKPYQEIFFSVSKRELYSGNLKR
jgi:hypothetical protein